MTKPDAIIFDLDGTLIHSAPDLHAAVNKALLQFDRAQLSLQDVISFVGNGVEKLVERSLNATGGSDAELHKHALAKFMQAYEADKTTLTQPYPGVMQCLEALSASGVPMAICTNKPQEPAREICEAMGLAPFFQEISGATLDVPKKPDAAPLLAVAQALNTSVANTLYVGDSVVDYQTAQAAKMPFRLFSGGYLNAPLPDMPDDRRFASWSTVKFTL